MIAHSNNKKWTCSVQQFVSSWIENNRKRHFKTLGDFANHAKSKWYCHICGWKLKLYDLLVVSMLASNINITVKYNSKYLLCYVVCSSGHLPVRWSHSQWWLWLLFVCLMTHTCSMDVGYCMWLCCAVLALCECNKLHSDWLLLSRADPI